MIFNAPSWNPELPVEIPDSTPAGEFILNGTGSLRSDADGNERLTDAVTGHSYSTQDIVNRVDFLARGLGHELGWSPNQGNPLDKVVAILSLNSIDYLVLCWAVHRLNGVVLPLHAGTANADLEGHLKASKCKALFACHSLAATSDEIAANSSIPSSNLFLIEVSDDAKPDAAPAKKSLAQLVDAGSKLPPLEPLQWGAGQGKEQTAYLAATSGTSGVQKLAKVTHFNIVANILQSAAHESYVMQGRTEPGVMVLPMSHAYALAVSQMMLWRGDRIIVHPRFDMMKMLESIPKYKVQRLYVIPPIISALAKNSFLLDMFDCSTVRTVVSGGGPLTRDLANLMTAVKPDWKIIVAYGLTETFIVASLGSAHDVIAGSSGTLVPRVEMRLLGPDGVDVEGIDQPGEVLLRGPNIVPGYLGDDEATRTLIDADGWLHSGDVAILKPSPKTQANHIFIVDRLKDIIKVNGKQTSSSDIEDQLLTHPAVQDAAVIGVPDDDAGERAQAYVVCKPDTSISELELRKSISDHIEQRMSQIHWLGERVFLIDKIPRSQSGKVLKYILRSKAKENQLVG